MNTMKQGHLHKHQLHRLDDEKEKKSRWIDLTTPQTDNLKLHNLLEKDTMQTLPSQCPVEVEHRFNKLITQYLKYTSRNVL